MGNDALDADQVSGDDFRHIGENAGGRVTTNGRSSVLCLGLRPKTGDDDQHEARAEE